ncbi:murein hydrolase activator EnvC family protein [Roseicyclus sp.]|jgi:murein hydrolase activator|uniref:murein hydrolase activator EnvC family protein n=1 Tax=Roseicyclus sp. TaxID=1914329 RepID=UPI003F695170
MSLRAITLAFVLLASPVRAEFDAGQTAAQAAEMLEQAGFALLEAQGARDRVEALTQTVRAYEEGLLALREGIRQAALRERTILMAFDAERDRLSRLLGVLQSIEAAPAPVVLMHPEGPLGTARAGMILSEVTPAVASQARALRAQLEELAALRAVQDMALRDLSDALERAQDARTQLSQAIAERRMLPENFLSDDVAMTQLVDSVDSLDTLSALLAQSPPAASPELPDFITARGALPLPVLGTQLRAFGEADAAGVARPGLVYATRAGALVTAPWPASVRYAGPLLDYGNVIILEPEAGYLLVLAGLDTVYVNTGVVIPAAGPLGLMPGGAESDTEELIVATLQGSGAALSETLYMELRENGVPVDPAEWFIGGGRN